MRFIDEWEEASQKVSRLLGGGEPVFLSRIGGSDTNAVARYLLLKDTQAALQGNSELRWHRERTAAYNGFYDKANNPETFFRYCEELLGCYESSTNVFMCNAQLLSMYFPGRIGKAFFRSEIENRTDLEHLIAAIEPGSSKTYYFYELVEGMLLNRWTLFNIFSRVLSDRRVLVLSPFSQSIRANFGNRREFFRNYNYPDFHLLTVNTPITYSGLPSELYPHSDWFETLQSLQDEIRKVDFDIALMGCGSYALPLGSFIERSLRKTAVYVGGILQLYFGVMGRRYSGKFVESQINLERYIYPLEQERYMKYTRLNEGTVKEAFGAYF